MIKRCIWKGERLSCSAIFSMYPTNRGMCCTFNKQRADELFRANRYQEQITRMTKQDKDHSFEDSTIPDWLETFSKSMWVTFSNTFLTFLYLGLIQFLRLARTKGLSSCWMPTVIMWLPHPSQITFRQQICKWDSKVKINMLSFQGFEAVIDSQKEYPLTTRKNILIRPGHTVSVW